MAFRAGQDVNGEFEDKIGQILVTLVSKHSCLRREQHQLPGDIKGDRKCEPGESNTLQHDVAQVHPSRQWATNDPVLMSIFQRKKEYFI
jgi:hypothetical protein